MPPPTSASSTARVEVLDERLAREGRTALAQACFDFLPWRAELDLAGWAESRHLRARMSEALASRPCRGARRAALPGGAARPLVALLKVLLPVAALRAAGADPRLAADQRAEVLVPAGQGQGGDGERAAADSTPRLPRPDRRRAAVHRSAPAGAVQRSSAVPVDRAEGADATSAACQTARPMSPRRGGRYEMDHDLLDRRRAGADRTAPTGYTLDGDEVRRQPDRPHASRPTGRSAGTLPHRHLPRRPDARRHRRQARDAGAAARTCTSSRFARQASPHDAAPPFLLPARARRAAGGAEPALKHHNTDAPIDFDANAYRRARQGQRPRCLTGNVRDHAGRHEAQRRHGDGLLQPAKKGGDPQSSTGSTRRTTSSCVTPSETASGRYGIYDVDRKTVTLIGGVTLTQQGGSVLHGQRLAIDLDTRPGEARRRQHRRRRPGHDDRRPRAA